MIEQKIAELQKQHADTFEITAEKGWLRIKSKTPTYTDHPAINGPAYLDYNINYDDHRQPEYSDMSRNVWLRTKAGKGFMHVSYCGGLGIWQVSELGEPVAASDISSESKRLVEDWLKSMDDYVLKHIPGLEEALK